MIKGLNLPLSILGVSTEASTVVSTDASTALSTALSTDVSTVERRAGRQASLIVADFVSPTEYHQFSITIKTQLLVIHQFSGLLIKRADSDVTRQLFLSTANSTK